MNITELRLLAYKKRNWQYTFIKLTPLKTEFETQSEISVVVHDQEELVNVIARSDDQFYSALSAVMSITGKTYFAIVAGDAIINTTKANFGIIGQISFSEKAKYLIEQDTKAAITTTTNINRFRGKATAILDFNITGLFVPANLIVMRTSTDDLLVETKGVLDVARVAKLQDYSNISLFKMDQDYTNWFNRASLARFHYSLY